MIAKHGRTLLISFLACLFVAGCDKPTDSTSAERPSEGSSTKQADDNTPTKPGEPLLTPQERIIGTWQVTQINMAGQIVQPAGGMPEKILIDEKMAIGYSDGQPMPHFRFERYEIDQSSDPMSIDFYGPSPRTGEPGTLPCIFRIAGDTLSIAMPMSSTEPDAPPMERPTDFDPKDIPVIVLTTERLVAD